MILESTVEYVLALFLIGIMTGVVLFKFINDDKHKKQNKKVTYRDSDDLIDWYINIQKIEDFSSQRTEMSLWRESALNNYRIRHNFSKKALPDNVISVFEHRSKKSR